MVGELRNKTDPALLGGFILSNAIRSKYPLGCDAKKQRAQSTWTSPSLLNRRLNVFWGNGICILFLVVCYWDSL